MNKVLSSWMLSGFPILLMAAGCKTMTGQTAGHNLDDTALTAAVKAQLATKDRVGTLTRIAVTTVESTVFLSGILPTQEEKDRAEAIARGVDGVKSVVDNIELRP